MFKELINRKSKNLASKLSFVKDKDTGLWHERRSGSEGEVPVGFVDEEDLGRSNDDPLAAVTTAHSNVDIDVIDDDSSSSDAVAAKNDGVIISDDTTADDSNPNFTYPADCYSFLALHTPRSNLGFFLFGFSVWIFQISFLILMVMRVLSPKHSTNEDVGNPSKTWLGDFIPSNVPPLARATQFFALFSYCIFSDSSVKDIVTAVETFPTLAKAKPQDKPYCLAVSSVLRMSQGLFSCVAVFLLVVNTADVIDIVLNFTAVGFISEFDDIAFELAQWGKYGPGLMAEANRIEELPAPLCIRRRHQHIRYRMTITPVAILLLTILSAITICQKSQSIWHTETLRVQFDAEETSLASYSGCYHLNRSNKNGDSGGRSTYLGNQANDASEGKFGYCKELRKWYLFVGNKTSACDAISFDNGINVLAYSQKTYEYDIYAVFEDSWYSRTGTPLEMYFFSDENDLTPDMCGQFLADGICDDYFNKNSYGYDNGDCCASTCEGSWCGVGMVSRAFNTPISAGSGYPTCEDPDQSAITIKVNDLYVPNGEGLTGGTNDDIFSLEARNPLMILECDNSEVLMITISPQMINQSETVYIADGAECYLDLKNTTSGSRDIFSVDYTIFHGDEEESVANPIVMVHGDSHTNGNVRFQRIPECFLEKLSKYLDDIATIYTGTEPQNEAIDWLMKDRLGFSSCDDAFFVERYALVVLSYANPSVFYNATTGTAVPIDDTWINESRQCTWSNIECIDGSVTELDLGEAALGYTIKGTVDAKSIGLLQNLNKLDMSANYIGGTIPTAIESWSSLTYLSFANNLLNGTIPSEISTMSNLNWFFAEENDLTGPIPNIGMLSNLTGFIIWDNLITGYIPQFLGNMESLQYLVVTDNPLSGTIPSQLSQLKNISYLGMADNFLNGTIPSSLGQLNYLETLELQNNNLVGSVPLSIVEKATSYKELNVFGNELSDLLSIDGQVICTATNITTGRTGSHYCNCASDCLKNINEGYGERCQCEEANDCCDNYFVDNNITNCVFCEGGFANPDFIVPEWDRTPCGVAELIVYALLDLFGTEEQCMGAKVEGHKQGCICPNFVPPGTEEDNILV